LQQKKTGNPFFKKLQKGVNHMEMTVIKTENAPAAIGPYSQAIAVTPLLFVSGQLGLIPESGELAGPDLASQARQALKNLAQVLKAGGSDLDKVASVDAFLTNMGDFAAFNKIYQDFFTSHKPARAVVGVNSLPKGALVEIKCIAIC
jgi:2-iminobutanoate/2-iminopropanoate deaminase